MRLSRKTVARDTPRSCHIRRRCATTCALALCCAHAHTLILDSQRHTHVALWIKPARQFPQARSAFVVAKGPGSQRRSGNCSPASFFRPYSVRPIAETLRAWRGWRSDKTSGSRSAEEQSVRINSGSKTQGDVKFMTGPIEQQPQPQGRRKGRLLRFVGSIFRRRTLALTGMLILGGGILGNVASTGIHINGNVARLLTRRRDRSTEPFVRKTSIREGGQSEQPTEDAAFSSMARPIPEAQEPLPESLPPSPPDLPEPASPLSAAPTPQADDLPTPRQPDGDVIPPPGTSNIPEESTDSPATAESRSRWMPFWSFRSNHKQEPRPEEGRVSEERGLQDVEQTEEADADQVVGEDEEEEEEEDKQMTGTAGKQEDNEKVRGEGGRREELKEFNKQSKPKRPFFDSGDYIDRRETVLANGREKQGEQQPAAPKVAMREPEQVELHQVRQKSSFVSRVYQDVGPAVPRVDCVKLYKGEVKFASGSGCVFTPDGYVITNSLLVRNALELKVTLPDGREYPAEVKGTDEVLDIAVLKILEGQNAGLQKAGREKSFLHAPIGDSDSLQVGDWVMSVGSPKSPGPSVILGIVSGMSKTAAEVGRPETQVNFIQTDASFDSAIVGGPLVNEFGEVVGITSIGMTTSSTVQFSVPINEVKSAIADLANGKAVLHPSIGVEMMPLTPSLAKQLNHQAKTEESMGEIKYIPEGGAVVLISVLDESPAQAAGLKPLDILLEIEKQPIYKVQEAQGIIKSVGVGRELEVKVLRKTKEVTTSCTTTDFLALLQREQEGRRYPELRNQDMQEKVEDGAMEGQSHRLEEDQTKVSQGKAQTSRPGPGEGDGGWRGREQLLEEPLKTHLYV